MNAFVQHNARALGIALLLSLAGGADTLAQPAQTASAVVDTFVAVVPRRPMEDIKKDVEQAKALRAQAKLRLERAKEEVHTLDIMIGLRQKDLDALEGHLDTLDSEKKTDEIAIGKGKVALLEKLRDLLELRKKVREGEAESATATVAHAEAQEDLYSLEGTLETKRNDRAELVKKTGSAANLAVADQAIKELEGEVLERWEKSLKKHEDSVSAEQDLLSLLRKLDEAQNTFNIP